MALRCSWFHSRFCEQPTKPAANIESRDTQRRIFFIVSLILVLLMAGTQSVCQKFHIFTRKSVCYGCPGFSRLLPVAAPDRGMYALRRNYAGLQGRREDVCLCRYGEFRAGRREVRSREAVSLREEYPDVTPAWHSSKKHWNDIRTTGDLPDALSGRRSAIPTCSCCGRTLRPSPCARRYWPMSGNTACPNSRCAGSCPALRLSDQITR